MYGEPLRLVQITNQHLPTDFVWLTIHEQYEGYTRRQTAAFFAEVERWCHEQFGDQGDAHRSETRWTLDYIDMIGFRDPADATATLIRWG